MRIRAKYSSTCDECNTAINEGDDIWWERETGALHWDCYQRRSENSKSPVKPVQAGVTVHFNPPKRKE